MARTRRHIVAARANDCCEYCHLPQVFSSVAHQIDHIRARKHRGPGTLENLCLACAQCNGAKASNAAGFDPLSDDLVVLFNPRLDDWHEHFYWDGALLRGHTAVGRATIQVLNINESTNVKLRALLMRHGLYPLH